MHLISAAIALLNLCALPARADTIQLDSGAALTGDLARYEYGGDCQISVTEGPLAGVIAVLPCHRIQSFVRSAPAPAASLEPPADDPFAAAFADPPPPARADLSWSRPAPEPAPEVATDPIAAVPAPREAPLLPAPDAAPAAPPAPVAADVPEGGASPEERRALSF